MAWRGLCGGLVHQLQQPVLFHTGYDMSYWLMRLSGFDTLLLQGGCGAAILVTLFFASGILLLLFPRQRIWAACFAATYLLQDILLNMYLCKTPHVQAGFAVILWSFCARHRHFGQWWLAMRYYVCYIFFTAFLWKLWYGSLFQWNGGLLFFREYAAPYLLAHPQGWLTTSYRCLLEHPFLLNLGEKLVFAAQGLFLAGCCTTKYDRFFIVFLALFITGLLVFGHHFFVEFTVLVLPLLHTRDWERWNALIPLRAGNRPTGRQPLTEPINN
jgi:hypothetical protein